MRGFGKPLFVLAACVPCCVPLVVPLFVALGIAGSVWALAGVFGALIVLAVGATLVVRIWQQRRRRPDFAGPVLLPLVEDWQRTDPTTAARK